MLKNYEKVIYKSERNGKPFCLVVASISNGELQLCRIDFEEWERNPRNGLVEIYYLFNEANTARLAELLETASSGRFVTVLHKKCSKGCFRLYFFSRLKQLCEENKIQYDFRVWY